MRLSEAQTVACHPRIRVTSIETDLKTRYTTDTLRALQQRFPKTRFVWLMGADNMQQIVRWERWPDIFQRTSVAVFRRPTYAAGRGMGQAAQRFDRGWIPASEARSLPTHKPPAWTMLDNPLNPLSATKIRKDHPSWPK